MKFKVLVFFIVLIVFGCKSSSTPMEPCLRIIIPLSSSINSSIKRGEFNINPLIVKNGKKLGVLNEFGEKFIDTTYAWTGNISKVFKGSKYFIDLYGEKRFFSFYKTIYSQHTKCTHMFL